MKYKIVYDGRGRIRFRLRTLSRLLMKRIENNYRTAMIKTTLKIDGMMCSMCESHVNDTVRQNFKVKKVSSSHSKGVTEIISEDMLDENTLRDTIGKTGYKVLDITAEPYENKKKRFSLFGR